MTEQESRLSPLSVLGDGLLMVCALTGLTGSFLSLYGGYRLWPAATALDRCAARPASFLLPAAAFALAALAAWSLPRLRGAAAGGLAGLWLTALALRWTDAVRGAGLTVHAVSALFAQRVSWGRVFQYAPASLTPAEELRAVTAFLLLALAALALALGWAVARARRWWLAALLTLPPLLPGLLADLYPSWPPFMALCACWCAMLLCDLCRWSAPSRRGALTLAALAGSALALAGLTSALPREGYTRPQWALDLEKTLQDAAADAVRLLSGFDGPFLNTIAYEGGTEEADLASAGPLRYTGRTVLRVTADCGGRLYLRGASLAVYEDGVWTPLPQEAYEAYSSPDAPMAFPLYFPAMGQTDGPAYTVTVDNVGRSGSCVYAPYFLTPLAAEDGGALPVKDSYLARRRGQWVYTLSFRDARPPVRAYSSDGTYIAAGSRDLREEAARRYSPFAYEHYLDVPEDCREELIRLCWDNGIYGGADGPIETAEQIAALLAALCEYDQMAEAPPRGADPVLYFLTESRRGYCMHFASTAVLMLRTLGIPARYVGGFTADAVPNRQVRVPDRAAHAWAEVWVNGFGWYPVEVTPAAAFAWMEPEAGVEPSRLLPSLPPEVTPAPTSTPTPAPSQDPAPSRGPEGSAPPAGAAGGPGPGGPNLSLFPIAVPAGAVLALWLTQRLVKRRRVRRLRGPDPNRAALDAYGYLLRLKRWGGAVDGRAEELAQKARFSQHTLTGEELDQLRALVDRERARLSGSLPLLPRLAFRWFWGTPGKKSGKSPENGP